MRPRRVSPGALGPLLKGDGPWRKMTTIRPRTRGSFPKGTQDADYASSLCRFCGCAPYDCAGIGQKGPNPKNRRPIDPGLLPRLPASRRWDLGAASLPGSGWRRDPAQAAPEILRGSTSLGAAHSTKPTKRTKSPLDCRVRSHAVGRKGVVRITHGDAGHDDLVFGRDLASVCDGVSPNCRR